MQFTEDQAKAVLDSVKFRDGLVVAVTIDHKTKDVLIVAFQNREAVTRTLTEGKMYYWSRSRKKLWMKGERSGNQQFVEGVRLDCDGDAILYYVKQLGGACHNGYYSCFHLEVKEDGKVEPSAQRVFEPWKVYE